MIKSQKQLFLAISLLSIVVLLNIPYPHSRTIGASLIIMNIPVKYPDGVNHLVWGYVFIIFFSLVLLGSSLKKYHGRFILLAIALVVASPQLIANVFQKTVATGIYAIEYNPGESNCKFDTIENETLNVECEFRFKNHSRNDVTFTVEFIEDDPFGDGIKSVSLLNAENPLGVTIEGKRREPIFIKEEIDITTLEGNYISSGSSSYVNIIMRDGNKYREL
ncbi:hypothetical protein [Halalkalibacter akibai]|uniref:Uncharacterized protein n=1 Tax=Halalkalibacter akibai (strain ATCC 43226 / DSM 21942 / CIP 109018 / JCM 9157 / 1139) TaxID=1236973 RepID=W4R140_HALA3|nr:hypothetical protein [Halalkalibacter akibai]GAE37613.1 hypothetical protein JCM9157_4930 [Halalkalibacter akibai JCM 9157]